MSLTSHQRKFLKGLGHSLNPVIHVGKEGFTDGLLAGIKKALVDHELIKVSILETADVPRTEAAELISKETESEIVQILGKKILFYKENKTQKKINLPS